MVSMGGGGGPTSFAKVQSAYSIVLADRTGLVGYYNISITVG